MLDALLAHRLPDFAQQLRILVAQVSSPLEVNSEGNARSADGPNVQVVDTLHARHGLQNGQNGCRIDPMGNLIHQFGQTIAQQHDSEPSHAQPDSKTCEWINPSPAGDSGDQRAQQHRS